MNTLRNVNILLEASLMKDPEVKTQIKHNKKNLIELNDPDDEFAIRPKLAKTLTMMMTKRLSLSNSNKRTKLVDLEGSGRQGNRIELDIPKT